MFIALALLFLSTVVLVASLQNARREGWRAPGLSSLRPTRALPLPPADDQPPANLSPLIPSPRALASEYERGLRDLTLFLAVQPRD